MKAMNIEEFVSKGHAAQSAVDAVLLLQRSRDCLKRRAQRYASSYSASDRVKETRALVAAIDDFFLRQ